MSSSLRGKKVVIFGGNGFIGSHLVNYLCNESCQIKILSRQEKANKKETLDITIQLNVAAHYIDLNAFNFLDFEKHSHATPFAVAAPTTTTGTTPTTPGTGSTSNNLATHGYLMNCMQQMGKHVQETMREVRSHGVF